MPNPVEVPFPEISFISQYFTDALKDGQHLLPAEAIIIERAAAKRRADFSTGRYCAVQALGRFVNYRPEILQGKGKEPLWPNGIVGSISHSQSLTGAVVARQADVTAIGLDIETIGGVQADMWHLLFNADEQTLIQSKQDNAVIWATLLFSLKESFYKLQYPLTSLFLDFTDMIIYEVNGRLSFSSINPQNNLSAVALNEIETHWTIAGNQLISICYIRQ
jgi:4'-phosphopantetheinyl transferase EntD